MPAVTTSPKNFLAYLVLRAALVEGAGCGRLGLVALGGVGVGGHEPGTEAEDPTPVFPCLPIAAHLIGRLVACTQLIIADRNIELTATPPAKSLA